MSLEIHYLCTFEHVKCGADQNIIDDADLNCIQKSDLRSLLFWNVMQHWYVGSYRCSGTSFQSHLQGSSSLDPWPWKTGLIDCLRMSVASNLSTLHDIPKEQRSHLNKGGILKVPRTDFSVVYMNRYSAIPWLRWLVTDLSPQRPRFKAWSVYMESAVNWVPMGHVSECNVIFPSHYQSTIVSYAFIFHWHFVILAVDRFVTWYTWEINENLMQLKHLWW